MSGIVVDCYLLEQVPATASQEREAQENDYGVVSCHWCGQEKAFA